MLVDGLTKRMDLEHIRTTLQRGRWSVIYVAEYVKSKKGGRAAKAAAKNQPTAKQIAGLNDNELPGTACGDAKSLDELARLPGWHSRSGAYFLVAARPMALRTPGPRVDKSVFRLRSTFGRYGSRWRVLEEHAEMDQLARPHALLSLPRPEITVTRFAKP